MMDFIIRVFATFVLTIFFINLGTEFLQISNQFPIKIRKWLVDVLIGSKQH